MPQCNQQGCNAQWKLSRDIRTVRMELCTFGAKSYDQSPVTDNYYYYCPSLCAPSCPFWHRIVRSVGTCWQTWHALPFSELSWKSIKGPLLVGTSSSRALFLSPDGKILASNSGLFFPKSFFSHPLWQQRVVIIPTVMERPREELEMRLEQTKKKGSRKGSHSTKSATTDIDKKKLRKNCVFLEVAFRIVYSNNKQPHHDFYMGNCVWCGYFFFYDSS